VKLSKTLEKAVILAKYKVESCSWYNFVRIGVPQMISLSIFLKFLNFLVKTFKKLLKKVRNKLGILSWRQLNDNISHGNLTNVIFIAQIK
jgi:hypothetical protein